MTAMPVGDSLDLTQRLCTALRRHHAEHLLSAVLTALGPHPGSIPSWPLLPAWEDRIAASCLLNRHAA